MNQYVYLVFCAILMKCNCDTNYNLSFQNISSNESQLAANKSPNMKIESGKETHLATEPRIVGGHPATSEGTKHVVSLRLKSVDKIEFGAGHLCGGTLVNSSVIATAAHCFYNKDKNNMREAKEFVVVMGTLNRFLKTVDALEYNVKRIHYHPKFSIVTLENDVATMIIDGEVPKNHRFVQPIQLAYNRPQIGDMCRVDGWGATRFDEYNPPTSSILLTIDIHVLDLQLCRTTNNRIKNGMICAGVWHGGKDSCQGDSGGPMVCNGVLVGIVSWGDKCGLAYRPGIYTDVNLFRDWILKNSTSSLFQFKITLLGIILVFSKLLFI